jgi:general secretion pathway protein K
MNKSEKPSSKQAQHGAALLTAMIIVALVSTLAAAMVWQQWRAVQVEASERARVQAAWILSGALDFARLILREDQRSGRPTALTEPWATPLAESRLSTFLAVDKSNADDGPEAFLSGSISDAEARYNLTNLVSGGKVNPVELATLERLCQTVGVESSVATRIANGLASATPTASGTATSSAAPLLPKTVSQLTWLGVDAGSLQALRPFVVLLPLQTPVNINTAPREVLAAAVNGLDLGTAERLLQVRQVTPFSTTAAFTTQANLPAPGPTAAAPNIGVHSDFFLVSGRLRLVDRVLVERSLVQRMPTFQINVLQRERISSIEQEGS